MSLAACPDRSQLQALLEGGLSAAVQSELSTHLESCEQCQTSLESLVAGAQSWEGLAKNLAEQPTAAPADLRRLVEEFKARGDAETSAGEEAGELPSLSFLSPPDKPEQLGKLGHYEVLKLVGRGGMGVVLKAFDPVLHRVVAIKVLAPQLATSASARRRFTREAVAAAAVSHDHVVSIHAVAEANGLPYLVMPYISGLSLQELLDRQGTPELKEVLRIGVQVAAGLSAAHAQGLVHRDIKPANILLENGVQRVKITDFGLARAVDDATLTQSGVLAGTPQYMAPEQARGEAVDARADLFSLGSVLYALCTGHSPFRASTTMGVIKRVCEDPPRPIREINADCPEWLSEIINKLLAKTPDERFQSAEEVEDLLKQHLAHLQQPEVAPRPKRVTPAVPARKRAWSRGRTIGTVLLLLAMILGGSSAWWGYTRVTTSYGQIRFEFDDPTMRVVFVDAQRRWETTVPGTASGLLEFQSGAYTWRAYKAEEVVHTGSFTLAAGGRQVIRVAAAPPKPADVVSATPPAAPAMKLDEDTVITDRGPLRISEGATIRLVTIYFEPNTKVIEQKYEADLWQIAQLAAETRDSLVVVRGHADPTVTLIMFVRAGMAKGVLKKESNAAGRATYRLHDKPFDLSNTAQVLACIEQGVVDGVEPDVRGTLSAARDTAQQRAVTVRDALLEMARPNAAGLDPDKVHILVAGIGEPAVEKPQNMEQVRANIRVDVRLIRVKPSSPPR